MNTVVAAGPVIPNFGQGSKCEQTNGWWCTDWLHAHWGDTLAAGARAARRALADRGRHRLRACVRARTRGVPVPTLDAPIGAFADFLYTIPSLALFQLLVPHHRAHRHDGRDRARFVHAAHPLPEHGRGAARRARGRARGGTRDGPHALADLHAGRASARDAGDHRRPPHRRRLDDLDRDGRCIRDPEGARAADLHRASARTCSKPRSSPPVGSRSRSRSTADALLALAQRVVTPWSRA